MPSTNRLQDLLNCKHARIHPSITSNDNHLHSRSLPAEIPLITVSADTDSTPMGPPAVAGTSSESAQPAEHSSDPLEPEDGVSSEGGEKAVSTEEEEGREAEPSTRTRSQTGRGGGVARRSVRVPHVSRGAVSRSGPTPIVWGEDQRHNRQQQGR